MAGMMLSNLEYYYICTTCTMQLASKLSHFYKSACYLHVSVPSALPIALHKFELICENCLRAALRRLPSYQWPCLLPAGWPAAQVLQQVPDR